MAWRPLRGLRPSRPRGRLPGSPERRHARLERWASWIAVALVAGVACLGVVELLT